MGRYRKVIAPLDPEAAERKRIKDEREAAIRKKLFPDRKGFAVEHTAAGWEYLPNVVRGCVCHRKPVVVLAIDRMDCFIRTEDSRSPEQAVNRWNHGMLTELSRLLHRKLDLDPVGMQNLLNGIGKQAGDELVGYYRLLRKLKAEGDHTNEKKSARAHIRDLEGFFLESFFFEGLDREYMIEQLRKRGEEDSDEPQSVELKRKKAREKYHRTKNRLEML
jgi:hypothetical protein